MGRQFVGAVAISGAFLAMMAQGCLAAPLLSATLVYGEPSTAEVEAADNFFASLGSLSGAVVQLDLTLLASREPLDGGEPGDSAFAFGPAGNGKERLSCGANGYLGIVDNYLTDYAVSFGHPGDYHHQVSLYSGTKSRYPAQTVVCGIEGYTQFWATPLSIQGYFQVTAAGIPTADQYLLVPVDPQ